MTLGITTYIGNLKNVSLDMERGKSKARDFKCYTIIFQNIHSRYARVPLLMISPWPLNDLCNFVWGEFLVLREWEFPIFYTHVLLFLERCHHSIVVKFVKTWFLESQLVYPLCLSRELGSLSFIIANFSDMQTLDLILPGTYFWHFWIHMWKTNDMRGWR